jgi:hypothetical protein
MDMNKIFQSKTFYAICLIIATLILLLSVFKAGTMVGSRRANFSCHFAENYRVNFGGPKQGPMMGFGDRDFMPSGGVVGEVIKIENSTITVKEANNTEKLVLIKEDTAIRKIRDEIKISDLKIDDFVVIIGEPNKDGQIEAKLIRVMPEPVQDLNLAPEKRIP